MERSIHLRARRRMGDYSGKSLRWRIKVANRSSLCEKEARGGLVRLRDVEGRANVTRKRELWRFTRARRTAWATGVGAMHG